MGVGFFPRRETIRLFMRIERLCKTADLLVIIKGDRFPFDDFEQFLSSIKCPLVLWYLDSIENVTDGLERAKLASFFLFFDRTDACLVQQNNIPASHIDLAADSRWYYPKKSIKKRNNISFLGTLYEERLTLLDHMVRLLDDEGIDIDIRGQYVSALKPWNVIQIKNNYPSLWKVIHHVHMASHETINLLNNRSEIGLNIMRKQSYDSLNLRVFELCMSGTFQLVKAHPALSRCFKIGSEIEVFNGAEEAAEKIRYFREHADARERIARAGLERARRDHTMTVRIREVISLLERNGVM